MHMGPTNKTSLLACWAFILTFFTLGCMHQETSEPRSARTDDKPIWNFPPMAVCQSHLAEIKGEMVKRDPKASVFAGVDQYFDRDDCRIYISFSSDSLFRDYVRKSIASNIHPFIRLADEGDKYFNLGLVITSSEKSCSLSSQAVYASEESQESMNLVEHEIIPTITFLKDKLPLNVGSIPTYQASPFKAMQGQNIWSTSVKTTFAEPENYLEWLDSRLQNSQSVSYESSHGVSNTCFPVFVATFGRNIPVARASVSN